MFLNKWRINLQNSYIMNFYESWYSVIVFFTIGLFLNLKQLYNKTDTSNSKFKGYRAGIVALIYSIALAIAKLSGKI